MPITSGFNHVATLTTDMDLTVGFYEQAFGAVVTFELERTDDHPWMKILDLGGGAALNVFEAPADEIIGERRKQGRRGAIDHFALAVPSRAELEGGRRAGSPMPAPRRSARSSSSAASGHCSSAIPMAWSSRSAAPSNPDRVHSSDLTPDFRASLRCPTCRSSRSSTTSRRRSTRTVGRSSARRRAPARRP